MIIPKNASYHVTKSCTTFTKLKGVKKSVALQVPYYFLIQQPPEIKDKLWINRRPYTKKQVKGRR
jgi:hypothetical protein